MEDLEIENNIKSIIDGLKKSHYPPAYFEEILARLIILKEIGFEVDIEIVLESMSISTNNDSGNYKETTFYEVSDNPNQFVKYKKSFDKIRSIEKQLTNSQNTTTLDDVFEDDFWSTKLFNL